VAEQTLINFLYAQQVSESSARAKKK